MSYIALSNGLYFDFNDVEKNDVDITTVAQALSRIPRFTAHTVDPYNVAQHSLLVSKLVRSDDPKVKLAALMHDAHESVIGDISTPVKGYLRQCKEFHEMEERVKAFFANRFHFSAEIAHGPLVKEADLLALYIERKAQLPLFSKDTWECDPPVVVRESDSVVRAIDKFAIYTPQYARMVFISQFSMLLNQVAVEEFDTYVKTC